MHIANELIGNGIINISIPNIGYILGAFTYTLLLKLGKEMIALILLVVFPLTSALIFINDEDLTSILPFTCAIGLINFTIGLVETLNLKLIIANSNRPEFFVGMLYFLSYLVRTILTLMFQ